MSFLVDYHMHTTFSDGKDHYPAFLEQARKKDLAEIGFTDHITLQPVDWAMKEMDYPVMKENLKSLCNNFSEDVQVRFGIEVDYFPDKEEELRALIAYFPADFVIGSVHFIDQWNFDSDKTLYGKWSNDELYRKYFQLVQQAARSGLFDVIAHLDLIKKFACWPENDQSHLFEETLKVIKEADVVMELNTSGFDFPCREFYPSKKIIEMAARIGVPVTLGSDAHEPSQLARHFDQAIQWLKEAGYTKITRFRNRQRGTISI
ncbi:histidinol-phosphatase HisJ family protein [Roseimarinus sediminis]|jgi:histidinol-phosphatase (PHP family)|uniref:histidinol-phosphatase HisJ family protein n=1 Tax=Roseimarinus sediminis TaxID=1610899 RepID=UPI003D196DA8